MCCRKQRRRPCVRAATHPLARQPRRLATLGSLRWCGARRRWLRQTWALSRTWCELHGTQHVQLRPACCAGSWGLAHPCSTTCASQASQLLLHLPPAAPLLLAQPSPALCCRAAGARAAARRQAVSGSRLLRVCRDFVRGELHSLCDAGSCPLDAHRGDRCVWGTKRESAPLAAPQ